MMLMNKTKEIALDATPNESLDESLDATPNESLDESLDISAIANHRPTTVRIRICIPPDTIVYQ
jgi:hypothetical protein